MTNRFDKLEHLLETCSSSHISDSAFLRDLVAWMPDYVFNDFYARHCELYEIEGIDGDGDEEEDNEL